MIEINPHTIFQPMTSDQVDDQAFRDLIGKRAFLLLRLAHQLGKQQAPEPAFTRPLLGDLLSQSTQLEELLDAYGARNNRRWYRLRALTAAIKLFAGAGYRLLHVYHALPGYHLLPIDADFPRATQQNLEFINQVLTKAAAHILTQAGELGLPCSFTDGSPNPHLEDLPPGRLLHDRPTRRVTNTAEIVTQLATAFLNLAAESELLNTIAKIPREEYPSRTPDPVSEENLRYLKHRFHNLQSLYDTYVSDTEVEHLDGDLPVLRGHVTVIFHLLSVATDLSHYYERHINIQTVETAHQAVVSAEALLDALMGYTISYAGQYLACGQRLCHGMLNRYAEASRVAAPVPNYRGFHVRPATLIAKIVRHYGSNVRMELDEDAYDAASPMDLFRANEKINARKRRWLISEISRFPLPTLDSDSLGIAAVVMTVVLTLAEQGKLVIYEQPLQLSTELGGQEQSLLQQVTTEIIRLQSTGQIDINTDLAITFSGDKRVLADLQLLASNGYGEDSFGNNIPLPKPLGYLRR